MTSLADMLDTADLTEDQYARLEAIASEAGQVLQPQFFRQRLRRVAHILIVKGELRKGAAGGQYARLADYFRDRVDTLEKARKIVGFDSEIGGGLAAVIKKERDTLDMLDRMPSDAKSKPELTLGVAMLVEIFAHHTGRVSSDISPGSRGEEYANASCRFVRSALEIMGIHLSHDRVWQLVNAA